MSCCFVASGWCEVDSDYSNYSEEEEKLCNSCIKKWEVLAEIGNLQAQKMGLSLAELYPGKYNTNNYMKTDWEKNVKTTFKKAKKEYIEMKTQQLDSLRGQPAICSYFQNECQKMRADCLKMRTAAKTWKYEIKLAEGLSWKQISNEWMGECFNESWWSKPLEIGKSLQDADCECA